MMTAVKQNINALILYVYLIYYTERIRRDKRYFYKEVIRILKENQGVK